MAEPDLKLVAIRYYSFYNPWIDVIVMVPLEYENKATECIYEALAVEFWDDSDDRFYDYGYCNYVRDELDKYNIPLSIVCFEEFSDNNDFLFNNYAKYIIDSGIKYTVISN